MTTLVAIHSEKHGTYIGSDTKATLGNSQRIVGPKWVYIHPQIAVGVSGAKRALDILANASDEILEGVIPDGIKSFNAYNLAMNIHNLLREQGWTDSDSIPNVDASFVFATPHEIYDIDSSFSICKSFNDEIIAVGSGEQYAVGCAYATGKLHTANRVRMSVEAGILNDPLSGGEVFIDRVK